MSAIPNAEQERHFTDFCEREYGQLVATLSFLLADRWLAEDLAQEALARTWLRWARVSSLDRPDLWVRRVAVNLAHTAWRKGKLLSSGTHGLDRPSPANPEVDESTVLLYEALEQLSPRQRTAVTLRFFADLSVADTAATMQCRDGTVKALTSQGIEKLRAAMQPDRENLHE
ncbi:MAG: SigE family RNA polymerase sigma factor [Actinomycetota bacterium]